MDLSKSECVKIVKTSYKREDVDVLSFGTSPTDAGRGFIAASNVTWIKALVGDEKVTLRFFIKRPPSNPYHFQLVQTTRAFYKEAEFFMTVYPLLEKYFECKVFPKCHYAESNYTVLEDLRALDYCNAKSSVLDVDHLKASLKSLASYHAASFLHEDEVKATFNQICPDLLFVSWFNHMADHPGNIHLRTGIKAMKGVFDKYFPDVKEEIKTAAVKILDNLPNWLLPSKKHRNALSHNDLWSNNIMFKYDDDGKVSCALLIDMQLFGYNPPAHDVFTLLFLNATEDSSRSRVRELTEFYYKHLAEIFDHFGHTADEFLSWEEFENSKEESIPLALGSALIFTHFTSLPEEYLSEITISENKWSEFIEKDRTKVVFKSIDNYPDYRDRLFAMINNLFDFITGDFNV